MTEVTLAALTKRYAKAAQPALDALSLTLPSGKLTALLGPSGCGKTTALKLIAGLISPTSGQITFDGQQVASIPAEKRDAVMVFQNPLLFPYMTVAENVGFGLKLRGIAAAHIRQQVAEMLARVQLSGLGARRPADLSGGQQQRAALARALILGPRVLLLDEPLSSLDAHLRGEMRSLIRDLQRETGVTMVVVTHDQHEAVVLADQIALILNGKLAQFAPPQAFYDRPGTEAVARFFGGRNFIKGIARGGQFHGPLGPLTLAAGVVDGPGTLTFRPESARLGSGENALTGVVTAKEYQGPHTRIDVKIGSEVLEISINTQDAAPLALADSVSFIVPPETLWLIRP